MQLSLQPYYTISGSALIWNAGNPVFSGNENIRLNVLLDLKPSQLPGLLTLLNTWGRDFLFSLPAAVAKDAEILKALLPACYLLASMDLYAAADMPFIPVLCEQPDEQLQTGLLQAYFDDQGIAALPVPIVNCREAGIQETQSCSFIVHNTATAADIYEPIHLLPIIIIFDSTPGDLVMWNQLAGQLQSGMIIDRDAKISFEQKRCEAEIARWENRSLLYRHFLQLSKQVQEQEYYEIVNWYNHEYEILPLWYKRFGHIIKVLMGKRRFRSLFSDNVKKYKD